MTVTLVVPTAAALHAVASEVADNEATRGDITGVLANKLYTALGQISTDLTAHDSSITTAATAAGTSIVDAGSFTAQTTVEGALQEIYQGLKTVQAQVNVPLATGILAAGTPMAAFADNASSNPGVTLADSKAVGIRWNDNATQTAVWYEVPMPQDLDDTAAIVLHFLVSATGTTNAPTMTVTAFFQTVGALHDADTDCGGTSSAYTSGTAKQVQELTLTLAAVDVPPAPAGLSFSVKPTDGTVGTDDTILTGMWIEYKRKVLTS